MVARTATKPVQPAGVRRVRDDARERLAVMAFSLVASVGLAGVLRLVLELGN